jgi:hypothetical protein
MRNTGYDRTRGLLVGLACYAAALFWTVYLGKSIRLFIIPLFLASGATSVVLGFLSAIGRWDRKSNRSSFYYRTKRLFIVVGTYAAAFGVFYFGRSTQLIFIPAVLAVGVGLIFLAFSSVDGGQGEQVK